jgi:UDP-glucose 4-epimerase
MTVVPRRAFITGGAGFIGSFFVDRLLAALDVERVTVLDNFSSGREWHLEGHRDDARLQVVRADIANLEALTDSMRGADVVIHLASNPDIARAATEPTIDFDQGTVLTNHVLEAMRRSDARTILYASGSGVYGDLGELEVQEDHGPLVPISTYGASKLAGEALISAYCHMFDLRGLIFRFGNVVGARQTHGVGFDFVHRLRETPGHLRILGDGAQSKSYVDVDDVVDAVLLANERASAPVQAYNVATGDYVTVREIAHLALELTGGSLTDTVLEFTGGNRGWKGDIPVVRLNTHRIRSLGWQNRFGSREALRRAMSAMLALTEAGCE